MGYVGMAPSANRFRSERVTLRCLRRGAISCRHFLPVRTVLRQQAVYLRVRRLQRATRHRQLSAAAFPAGFGASKFVAGEGLDSFSSVNFHDVSLYCSSPFNQT